MNAMAAISAYNRIGKESAINGADPHELISMLFQGALLAIADAKYEIQHREVAAKGRSISKAIAIIGEGLNAGLNFNAGGTIARDLSSLYDYMIRRLVTANLENDVAILDEVSRLLGDLASAWNAIRSQAVAPSVNGSATPRGYTTA